MAAELALEPSKHRVADIRSGGAAAQVAAAHGVMVAVMAMTPVHLLHQGATLTIIGVTLSLHIAGMYALSPVFGILADRFGRIPTILLGQVILAAALITASFGQNSTFAVTLGLILVHLATETARHAGHADILRELLDGRTGMREGVSNLPDLDDEGWSAHRERVEEAARQAAQR